jgi:peptidoglycan/LPS O-acetylase OafA/YrhL
MLTRNVARQESATSPKLFRQDINGLRAWAVISVVLYHFGVPGFSGGFIGVDVFFVISGFLMTSIIISGLEKDNFSLWGFYLARARRIIPALIVLCTTLLILGWFWLPSADYKTLGNHASAALSFFSNFKFWREAGYFDTASHEKWLLHTWSLSVEWQFYILLPIGCLLLWRWLGRNGVKLALVFIAAISLTLSIYVSAHWPGAAFYLLPTRVWEMLAGGLIWWITSTKTIPLQLARLFEGIGFSLILLAVILFNSTMQWPGYFALVPVIGAMLVLTAKRSNSFLTANSVANRLGKSSYSIYLWHWPLVVLLTYIGEQRNPLWIAAGIGFSILIGELSYHCIENTTRPKLASLNKIKELSAIAVPASIVVCGALFINLSNGLNIDSRYGASLLTSKYVDKYSTSNYLTPYVKNQYKEDCNFFDAETYTAKDKPIPNSCIEKETKKGHGVFLWGDSHAQALSFGIRSLLNNGINFYQIASSGCQPHIGGDTATEGEFKVSCDRSNKAAIDAIAKLKPDVVIMAQRSDHEKNNYDQISSHLIELGIKHIILIGPVPQWQPSLPRAIALRHFDQNIKNTTDDSFEYRLFDTDKTMKSRYRKNTIISYISLLDQLCKGDECLAKVDNVNTPLIWDYGHLSLEGSKYIAQHILSQNEVLATYLK